MQDCTKGQLEARPQRLQHWQASAVSKISMLCLRVVNIDTALVHLSCAQGTLLCPAASIFRPACCRTYWTVKSDRVFKAGSDNTLHVQSLKSKVINKMIMHEVLASSGPPGHALCHDTLAKYDTHLL